MDSVAHQVAQPKAKGPTQARTEEGAKARPRPGPSLAQAWLAQARPGMPNFGIQKNAKIKIHEIQICSAQNVGKVQIRRKRTFPALFGVILRHSFHRPEKYKICFAICFLCGAIAWCVLSGG